MKAILGILAAVAILTISALAASGAAQSPPSLPFLAIGKANIEGLPAPDGLPVEALINGVNYVQPSQTRLGMYAAVVRADDPSTPSKEGGVQGDVVTIRIGGKDMQPTLVWDSGKKTVQDYNYDIENVEPRPRGGRGRQGASTTGNVVTAGLTGIMSGLQSLIMWLMLLLA